MPPSQYYIINPETGEPYHDFDAEEFEGLFHVRKAHYPNPDFLGAANLDKPIGRHELPGPGGIQPTHKPLAGLRQNNRGGSQALVLGTSPVGVIPPPFLFQSVVETPKSNGDDAEDIVVTLGFNYLGKDQASILAIAFEATAILEWGIGGITFTAEVDWQNGTTFSISASFVRVGLKVVSPPVLVPPIEVLFTASLSYGVAARIVAGARKTLLVAPVLGGGISTVFFPAPQFAESFGVTIGGGGPAPSLDIRFVEKSPASLTFATFNYVSTTNLANQMENQFPIPNGLRFFRVSNLAVGAVTGVRLIFTLGL